MCASTTRTGMRATAPTTSWSSATTMRGATRRVLAAKAMQRIAGVLKHCTVRSSAAPPFPWKCMVAWECILNKGGVPAGKGAQVRGLWAAVLHPGVWEPNVQVWPIGFGLIPQTLNLYAFLQVAILQRCPHSRGMSCHSVSYAASLDDSAAQCHVVKGRPARRAHSTSCSSAVARPGHHPQGRGRQRADTRPATPGLTPRWGRTGAARATSGRAPAPGRATARTWTSWCPCTPCTACTRCGLMFEV